MKTLTSIILLLGCCGSAVAAGNSEDLTACRAIESVTDRVACYDAIVDAEVAVVPEVPAAPAVVAEAVSPEQLFGKTATEVREIGNPEEEAAIRNIRATVTAIRKAGIDRIAVTLDNGQLWQQVTSSYLRLKVGDEIQIRKASLNSFILKKTSGNSSMRVRRIDRQ